MIEMSDLPKSLAFRLERERLPEEVREHFDALVVEYRYYATVHHGHPFVSYPVLADLIKSGWRLSTEELGG